MKNKYQGLLTFGIVLLCFFTIAGYGIYYAKTTRPGQTLSGSGPLPDIQVVQQSLINEIDLMQPRLPDLPSAPEEPANASLELFGYTPVAAVTRKGSSGSPGFSGSTSQDQTRTDLFDYQVTLSFVSPKNSFCVIDGHLYAGGAKLPDSGRIKKIEHDRVLIQKNNMEKWVDLVLENNGPARHEKDSL